MKLFQEFTLKNMVLKNRVVMPPMCMYIAAEDGLPTLFHISHYAARAYGGTGLVIVESTGVTPQGRISDKDLGLWNEQQKEAFKQVVAAVHMGGAKIAIQINHAGRRSESLSGTPLAPSALAFSEKYRSPMELNKGQIAEIIAAFRSAAIRANEAGFDGLEIHAAHGYLIHEFLSPLTNHRTDEYGGSLENRTRILKEVLKAVHEVWPAEKPVWMRVSAYDYAHGGIDGDMMVQIVNQVSDLIDMVHVSTGGLVPVPVHDYPGYQIPYAEQIRRECGKPVVAVGLITNPEMAEEILQNERADLVAFGREHLREPYFALKAALKYSAEGYIPASYERAYPR